MSTTVHHRSCLAAAHWLHSALRLHLKPALSSAARHAADVHPCQQKSTLSKPASPAVAAVTHTLNVTTDASRHSTSHVPSHTCCHSGLHQCHLAQPHIVLHNNLLKYLVHHSAHNPNCMTVMCAASVPLHDSRMRCSCASWCTTQG